MKFIYRAKDKAGNLRKGTVEARSIDMAVNVLQSHDLIVLDISPEKKFTFLDAIFGKKTRISRKELSVLFRQFATLISSEVPLVESLKSLIYQSPSTAVRDLIYELIFDLDAGLSLSKAVERRPDVFGEFYSEMIKSGEISGRLSETIEYLADYAEHEYDLITKARSSATYPLFLFATFVIIGVVISIALAPQLLAIFEEFGKEPPFGTKILILMGNFLNKWGLLLLVVVAGLIWMLINYSRSPEGKKVFGVYILKIPIIGQIYRKIFISRFAEIVGVLIASGIPPVTAFEVAGNATGNYIYQILGQEIAETIKSGESISNTLKKYPQHFPPLVSQMVAVGENTGKLDQVFKKVAEYYQKEVAVSFATLLDLLQPILIMVVGVFVSLLIAAVLLPIYDLAQAI